MNDQEARNVYYGNMYDLTGCIKNQEYSLYDLFDRGIDLIKQNLVDEKHSNNGSFIILTNNQYIIGDTPIDGAGTHAAAYASAMNLMYGNRPSSKLDQNTVAELSNICTSNFITARIVCEPVIESNGSATLSTYVNFYFPRNKKISENQYRVLEQFYKDFNEHFKNVINNCQLKKFICINGECIEGDDLTEVLDYFKNLISKEENVPEIEYKLAKERLNGIISFDYETGQLYGEKIIGVPVEKEKKY